MKDALHVSCGRCRGSVKGLAYLAVGNDASADQLRDFLVPGREPGLLGVGLWRQPVGEHFDHCVRAAEAMPVVANENHSGGCDEDGQRGLNPANGPSSQSAQWDG